MTGSRRGIGTVATVLAVLIVVPLLAGSHTAPDNLGKTAFERICAGCHGEKGGGEIGPRLVPFTRSGRELLAIVREGTGMMPAISARDINDEEVAAVAEYLKSLTDESTRP